MSDYTQTQGYQDIYKRIFGNTGPGGFQWNQANTSSKLQQMSDQFSGMFRNAVGRDPNPDELSSMFENIGGAVGSSPSGFSNTSYADFQNLFNPYIQNTYGQQIQQNQQQQQQTQLGTAQQQIQDLIKKQVSSTASDLTNPNSPTYQAFSGQMNNLGITPSSGAFQAGLGATLGQAGANDISAALGGVSLPAISGQMATAQAPYQMSMQNMYPGLSSYGGRQNDIYDFMLQSDLGQKLFDQSQPSGFEKGLGYANSASNIVSNLASTKKNTWICTAMWKNKVLASDEVDRLHNHLFKSFFKKFWKFMGYFAIGRFVVLLAEINNVNWEEWRPLFYDRVISEKDSLKAVDLYEDAFWTLTKWAWREKWHLAHP